MKRIPEIIRNITILYYILLALFVGVIIFDIVPDFIAGYREGQLRVIAEQGGGRDALGPIVMILAFPLIISFVWSAILLIRLIYHTGRSIARKDIFDPKCRKLIKWYAIITGSLFFLTAIISLIEWCQGICTHEINELIYDILLNGMQIVMLVILGQVLRIGEILKKEQNLTI